MCAKISQILDLPFHTDAPKNIEYPVGFNLPASYWDSDDDRRDKFDCYYCLSLVCVQMGSFAIRKGFRIHQRLLSLQAQFALTSWKMFPAIKHKRPQRTKSTNEIILPLKRVYAVLFFIFPKLKLINRATHKELMSHKTLSEKKRQKNVQFDIIFIADFLAQKTIL